MIEAVVGARPAVEPARCRAFRLSDSMILVVGAALGFSATIHRFTFLAGTASRLLREVSAHGGEMIPQWSLFWNAVREPLRNTVWYGGQAAGEFLLVGTLALFVLRLRRPRPALRALLRQPGTVAGLAIVFGLFWGTGGLLALFPRSIDSFTAAPTAMGGAVALGWIALTLGRWPNPEAGWLDRMGRLLGWVAIGNALIGHVILRI